MKKIIFPLVMVLTFLSYTQADEMIDYGYYVDEEWEKNNYNYEWKRYYFVDELGENTGIWYASADVFVENYVITIIVAENELSFKIREQIGFQLFTVKDITEAQKAFYLSIEDGLGDMYAVHLQFDSSTQRFVVPPEELPRAFSSLLVTPFIKACLRSDVLKKKYLFNFRGSRRLLEIIQIESLE